MRRAHRYLHADCACLFWHCAAPWYDLGCDGGDFEGGVDYIVANGGICTEEAYPYLAHDAKCMCAALTPLALLSVYFSLECAPPVGTCQLTRL